MDNDETVQSDATNQNEELDLDLNLDDTEDVGELKAALEKERQAKAQILARAKKAEALAKSSKPLTTKKNDELDSIKQDLSELKQEKLKRQFGFENGLSPDEVDKIFQLNANPTKETLEDEFIKAGLNAIRAKKRIEANTPGSSTTSGRITPPKPLTEMTADEKQKFHEEKMKAMYGDK